MAVRPFSALVVETKTELRSALATRLRGMGAVDVTEVGTAAEARAVTRQGAAGDLCLVDLDLAEGGLGLLRELRAAGWRRVLVLASTGNAGIVRAAFAAGAQGLLFTGDRDTAADGVVPGLVTPAPVSPSLRAVADLSGREIEVIRLVADGQSNKEVGEALGLSALTVKSHLARIARKLGTGDRAEMVALALRAGVIS
ncbi:MAG: response regulator transcription factor [Actinomycetota bacterium]|nr:response regulator transcription factor [Actinomycetota bacterium]